MWVFCTPTTADLWGFTFALSSPSVFGVSRCMHEGLSTLSSSPLHPLLCLFITLILTLTSSSHLTSSPSSPHPHLLTLTSSLSPHHHILSSPPPRYSYHHKLIPLLLTCMTDELPDIRSQTHTLWEKVCAIAMETCTIRSGTPSRLARSTSRRMKMT